MAAAIDQGAVSAGTGADGSWARDWQAVRDAGDIQYAPVAPPAPPETPEWLKRLGEWLEALFGPLGRWLGLSWPVFEKPNVYAQVHQKSAERLLADARRGS